MKINENRKTNQSLAVFGFLWGLVVLLTARLHPLDPAWAQPAGPQGEHPAVTVAVIAEQEVNPPLPRNGRVEAVQSVDLRARVAGFLNEVRFQEGADVKKGALLYVIERAPYEAALQAATAAVSQAEAALANARQFLKRLRSARKGAVAEADLEAAQSDELQAEAGLQAAKARRRQAELDLGYTRIHAPIDGRIGRTAVTAGNLVGPDSGVLARIVQLHLIRVVYSVSEDRVFNVRLDNSATSLADLSATFVPEIQMPNGAMYPHKGKIDFLDNQVDAATGTVAIWTLFPNPETLLLPGQFVKVIVRRDRPKRMAVVPQSAVMEDREGKFVFVLDGANIVSQRRIRTGPNIGTGWAVEDGLQMGESVIVQGVQKIRPGQTVRPSVEGRASGGSE